MKFIIIFIIIMFILYNILEHFALTNL